MGESRVHDFQVWQSEADGLWYWRLRAKNYESVAVGGEGFSSKEACLESIEIVKTCGTGEVVEITDPNA